MIYQKFESGKDSCLPYVMDAASNALFEGIMQPGHHKSIVTEYSPGAWARDAKLQAGSRV